MLLHGDGAALCRKSDSKTFRNRSLFPQIWKLGRANPKGRFYNLLNVIFQSLLLPDFAPTLQLVLTTGV